jgi:hypothetical protein
MEIVMSSTNPTTGSPATGTPAPSPQTLDAQDKIARLRAIADSFPDETQLKPLTPAERQLANRTPIVFVEKAALFAEAAPAIGVALSVDPAELRDAIASDLASGGIVDETRTLTSRIESANTRKKLAAVKMARGLYRVAKGYVTTDLGNAVRPHVEEMGRALKRVKRTRKSATPKQPPVTTQSAPVTETDKTPKQ